jgi:DNA invertase Pin-like site-specific DNA recombinase
VHDKVGYSYIRFSTVQQAQGNSYDRQLSRTRDYCALRGMTLDEKLHFSDLGVSAWKGKNLEGGELGYFLQACREGTVKRGSALIVEGMDRLSRLEPFDAIHLLYSLVRECGVEVHLTTSNTVFSTDSKTQGQDLLYALTEAIRANSESVRKSDLLCSAWQRRRTRAERNHERILCTLPWWLILENEKIVSPPPRRATVLEIFKLTAAGNSSAQIARELNTRRRPTWRRQTLWTSARVRDLIRSKGPQGVLQATRKTRLAGHGYAIAGYYPVIVTEALASRARGVMESNTRGDRGRPSENKRPINIFRGLLRQKRLWTRHATHQNGRWNPATKVKAWNSYYECFDELAGGKKGKLLFCISAKQLEPVVFAGLSELKPEDLAPPAHDSAAMQTAILDEKLRELEKAQKNLLLGLQETGLISIANKLEGVEKEIARRKEERERLQRRSPAKVWTGEFKAIVENLNDPDIRMRTAVALRRIVKRIDIARSFEDLPVTDDFRKRFINQRGKVLAGAHVFKDPVPNTKRRKPLHVMISFSTGVCRYIGRVPGSKDQLISWRIEAYEIEMEHGNEGSSPTR